MGEAKEDVKSKEIDDDARLAEEEKEYERMFAKRYTEDDPTYAKTKHLPDPPCIYPWYSRPKRFYDFAR